MGCVYIYIYGEMEGKRGYSKELSRVIMEAGDSKFCRVGRRAGDPGKSQCCSSSPKAVCWQNSLSGGGHSLSYLSFH